MEIPEGSPIPKEKVPKLTAFLMWKILEGETKSLNCYTSNIHYFFHINFIQESHNGHLTPDPPPPERFIESLFDITDEGLYISAISTSL